MSLLKFVIIGFFLLWFGSIVGAHYLFDEVNYSPVLYDRNGVLLGAKVAKDGQWRFPVRQSLPESYIQAVTVFEDKRFFYHLGIDPIAIIQALYKNITRRKIVSGGSTITMQVVRLALKTNQRTLINKLIESWLATGLEFLYSKKKILFFYSQLAPYGSNVVGIESAMWRYYSKDVLDLSWAEASLLAVLPNQPSMLHVNRNRELLKIKRDHLLNKLQLNKLITTEELELAKLEPLPDKPNPLPKSAPHLLEYLIQKYPKKYIFNSTIDDRIQNDVIHKSSDVHKQLLQNEIHNLAVLVVDNNTGEIISYLGNSADSDSAKQTANTMVDMVNTPRSSGSILKPLLYAAAMDRGLITPCSVIPDIPILINGFRAENFSRQYQGLASGIDVIQKSLNVPSVLLLKDYGIPAFYLILKKLKFSNLFRPADDYGLSLILGGAEINMKDLAWAYSYLANTNTQFVNTKNTYPSIDSYQLSILLGEQKNGIDRTQAPPVFSVGSIYNMFNTMSGSSLSDSKKNNHSIAWKTGTSFGYKDAWCVGITPQYTVVVWVGNSNGMSRPGLIGAHVAAPLMFDVMEALPNTKELEIPYDDLKFVGLCRHSGFLPNPNCKDIDSIFIPNPCLNSKQCPYHETLHLDTLGQYQVYRTCEQYIIDSSFYVLPPTIEYFYRLGHPELPQIPAYRFDCLMNQINGSSPLAFIYPNKGAQIITPIDLKNQERDVVFKATHRDPQATVQWFMDETYIGETKGQHQISINPSKGVHIFMIMDDLGHSSMIKVDVLK